MGFRWRRHTGGKSAWINWFSSTGNGFGASGSVKIGNVTLNVRGRRRRVTVKLGNGVFWTKQYTSPKNKPVKEKTLTKAQLRALAKSKEDEELYWKLLEEAELKEREEYYKWFDSLTEDEQAEQLARLEYHRDEIKKLYDKQEKIVVWSLVAIGLIGIAIFKFLGWLFF